MFAGRAYDALGWAQFKKGNTRAALESLIKAVDTYPSSLDRKTAIWHLAVATQEAGDDRRALDPDGDSDILQSGRREATGSEEPFGGVQDRFPRDVSLGTLLREALPGWSND